MFYSNGIINKPFSLMLTLLTRKAHDEDSNTEKCLERYTYEDTHK